MLRKPVSEVVRARQELTRLGIVEDSGKRKRDPDGNLTVVWKLSPLGELVGEYQRLGMTFEEAWAKTKTAVDRPAWRSGCPVLTVTLCSTDKCSGT